MLSKSNNLDPFNTLSIKISFPMSNRRITGITILSALFLINSACKHEIDFLPTPDPVSTISENDSLKLTWTAFKFTNRTALQGTFTDIQVTHPNAPGGDLAGILDGVQFDINTNSVNTGMEFRDYNITHFLFSQILDGAHIQGSISASSYDRSKNQCTIHLNMNGTVRDVTVPYTMEGKTLVLEGALNLADWGEQAPLDTLNSHVIAYHTGADGVNKLWSDVQFRVEYARKNF
jgi:polyisoprenoid-binding protein YceI